MSVIEQCVSDVYRFNEIGENFSNIKKERLLSQAKVVLEEAEELFCAIAKDEGPEQNLKECVDVLVTITGFVGMLETLGYDVWGAWEEVNKNNLTKFTHSTAVALDTVESLTSQGVKGCSFTYNDEHDVFVIKDGNGKIRKPNNYKKCSVKDFLPK